MILGIPFKSKKTFIWFSNPKRLNLHVVGRLSEYEKDEFDCQKIASGHVGIIARE